MKKKFRKLIVINLILIMLFTSVSFTFANTSDVVNLSNGNDLRDEIIADDKDNCTDSETCDEQTNKMSSKLVTKEEKNYSETTSVNKEDVPLSQVNSQVSGDMEIVYIESPELKIPGTQNIAIVWKTDLSQVKDATLIIKDNNGRAFELCELNRTDKAILFSRDFVKGETGKYSIEKITYYAHGNPGKQAIAFSDINVNSSFDVINSESEYALEDGVAHVDISSVNTDTEEANKQIADAINETGKKRTSKDKNAPVVVVFDPGHGGSDAGACGFGLKEKDLNLKIALYCKEELMKYAGIEVYMTRSDDSTTPGKDAGEVMDNLIKVGSDHNADIFVSIHINAGDASGAEIWYPNDSSWKNEYHTEGGKISQNILNEILKLGLNDRGIKTKDDSNPVTYYPDGSVADWYGIIRRARLAGFPGIIVEHAFIDNANDAKFLSSDENLRKLGIADATGIANYFGLSKGSWEENDNGIRYKFATGEYATGHTMIDGVYYFFNDAGYMQTGWQIINENWYYFDHDGKMVSGWKYLDNKWYFMNTSGVRVKGWQTIEGKSYYFHEDGHMANSEWTPDGFYVNKDGIWIKDSWKSNSKGWWYEYGDGTYAIGWKEISNKWYFFNRFGYMQAGWIAIDGIWYYMDKTGERVTGWQVIGGKHYYFYEDGHMAAGEKTPDGFFVNKSGAWIVPGWKSNSKGWWYLNEDGEYAVGWKEIADKWYFFDNAGYMKVGWVAIDGKWYYMDKTGARVTGWQVIGGKHYYFYEDGHMAAGEKTPDGFFVNKSGAWIVPGWKSNTKGWWYLNEDGEYAVGWKEIANKWYFFDNAGYMKVGWVAIDGKWYYFNGSGEMQTGWQKIDGLDYYFYSDGHLAQNCITPDGFEVTASGEWFSPAFKAMIKKADAYYSPTGFLMLVNCKENKVVVLRGSKGNWKYNKLWACTSGAQSTPTVKGVFHIGDRGTYFDSGAARCHWWTQFYEDYLFHSVLYNKNGTLYDGRLGMALSHGCIRLKIENAKWVYDNIPRGTKVVIY